MPQKFYSNGKLLLSGEYLVLDGALSLAVPTKFGQGLEVAENGISGYYWQSFDHLGKAWFACSYDKSLQIERSTDMSVAKNLQKILQEAKRQNPNAFGDAGLHLKTTMDFPADWGLGSSSTLINNIAQWAKIDAYKLLWNAFSGSGYDIACAQHNTPITYRLKDNNPIVKTVDFNPLFKDQLYFVHLNKKQNSRDGIAKYKNHQKPLNTAIQDISAITNNMITCGSLNGFEKLIAQHELIIANIIDLPPVKKARFPDYFGAIKSLGAWGGDFILATGNNDTPSYFKEKGFDTVLGYDVMVL